MVSKKCVMCGAYFAGVLDGDYTCPRCQASGVPRRSADWYAVAPPDETPAPAPQKKSSSQAA